MNRDPAIDGRRVTKRDSRPSLFVVERLVELGQHHAYPTEAVAQFVELTLLDLTEGLRQHELILKFTARTAGNVHEMLQFVAADTVRALHQIRRD